MKRLKILTSIAVAVLMMITYSQAQSWITNGLVAYYPFNGNANDESGNNNNGTASNAALGIDRFGNTNASYAFNGVDSFVSVPNNPAISSFSNQMTISCWFTLSNNMTFGEWPGIVSKFATTLSSPSNGFMLRFCWGSALVADLGGDAGGVVAQYSQQWVTDGTIWYHCVAIASNNITTIYMNGHLVSSGTNFNNLNTADQLTIGGQNGSWDNGLRNFSGKIDDVRIYNRALSLSEVAQLYSIESGYLNIQKAIYLVSDGLAAGSNYQLQVSVDLQNWTNQGAPFAATGSYWRSTNYWDVANWNQLFFRLKPQ